MAYDSLVVEADGGSRGNPGVAGYGALVRDGATGELLAERAEPLGKVSNNVAEYRGLIAGLEAAALIDASAAVLVRMDSKLVVEQMSGRWKIKHDDMLALAAQARSLIAERHSAVRFEWIPRAQNKAADKLSNDGMDGHTVIRDLWRREASSDGGDGDAPAADPVAADKPSSHLAAARTRIEPVRVLLVRHGVTDFTASMRIDGRGGLDPQLNADGRRQADQVAAAVASFVHSPARVVTSALQRAMQTGAAIADRLGIEPVADDAWDEQSYGDWDGMSLHDLAGDRRAGLLSLRNDPDWDGHGGETHTQVAARVDQAVDRLLDQAEPGDTVIVVTHRRPIMCVFARVLEVDLVHSWQLACAPASLTGIEFAPDGTGTIAFANDTHHLRPLR